VFLDSHCPVAKSSLNYSTAQEWTWVGTTVAWQDIRRGNATETVCFWEVHGKPLCNTWSNVENTNKKFEDFCSLLTYDLVLSHCNEHSFECCSLLCG